MLIEYIMDQLNQIYYPIDWAIGHYNNPRTGNPGINQPVFHGMIEGFVSH